MKRTYIEPELTTIDSTPCAPLATSVDDIKIYDNKTGGDDGNGGYDPGNSLSRDHNNAGNNLWDNVW